jgi:hypothetical protein
MTTKPNDSGVRMNTSVHKEHFEILDLAEAREIPVAKARKLVREYGHAGDTLRQIARFALTVDAPDRKPG